MIPPFYSRRAHRLDRLQEVEQTVSNCHPLLKGNCAVVFRAPNTWRERWIAVVEVSRRLQHIWELDLTGGANPLVTEVKAAVTRAVASRHGLIVARVVFTPRRTLPRGDDGAIERNACRQAFFDHALRRVVA